MENLLLLDLWDANKGKICINGEDIKSISSEHLLKHISMAMQDTYLFHDTIKNNILFGREDASQEELKSVCKRANCHEFIMNLPERL